MAASALSALESDAMNLLEEIRKEIHHKPGSVIPIVGSGLSQGLIGWRELLSRLVADLPDAVRGDASRHLGQDRLLDVASVVSETLGQRAVRNAIASAFGRPVVPMPVAYSLLAKLPIRHFATTNFDPWMKAALLEAYGRRLRIVLPVNIADNFDVNPNAEPWLLMLHGSAEQPESCVLTGEEYRRLLHNHLPFRHVITTLLHARRALFVGYSLSDPDIQFVLEQLHEVVGLRGRHWIVVGGSDAVRDHALRSRGVIPVSVGPDFNGGISESVLEFLASPPRGLPRRVRQRRQLPSATTRPPRREIPHGQTLRIEAEIAGGPCKDETMMECGREDEGPVPKWRIRLTPGGLLLSAPGAPRVHRSLTVVSRPLSLLWAPVRRGQSRLVKIWPDSDRLQVSAEDPLTGANHVAVELVAMRAEP